MINLRGFKIPKLRDIHPKRYMKYQLLKLLRSPGGAKQVAAGFALGLGVEIILPTTAYVGYVLLVPLLLIKSTRSMFPSVVIGNLVGKATFLPLLLLPIAYKTIHLLFHQHHVYHGIHQVIWYYQRLLFVLAIFGIILGIISYYLVYWAYQSFRAKRLQRRKERRAKLLSPTN